MHSRRVFRILISSWLLATPAWAQAPDEQSDPDDLLPGLVARYTVGDHGVERIDSDVQFVWNGSPDQRLPAQGFSARWSGQLLVRSEDKHRFHLYLEGEATVSVAGRVVVQGKASSPAWVSGDEVTLEFGELPLEITFRSGAPQGTLRLFWSAESFRLEPVPVRAYFHAGARPEFARVERGHDLYTAHRCNRCHERTGDDPAPVAPPLRWAAAGLSRDWLTDWLVDPSQQAAHARMPRFGFSREEAGQAAEYLLSQAAPVESRALDIVDRGAAARQGQILFRSVGCLACHVHGDLGTDTPFSGGDLTRVGQKRSARWIYEWLADPDKLNPAHHMPVFRLSDAECEQLAAYLADREGGEPALPNKATFDEKQVAAGQKLVSSARCAACHVEANDRGASPPVAPGGSASAQKREASAAAPPPNPPFLRGGGARGLDWSRACTEAEPDKAKWRPAYRLSEADRLAVRAFVDARTGELFPADTAATAQRLLRQKNCFNCHERDGGRGISALAGRAAALDPDLAGQSEAMMPPDLSAVGDKLRDDYLALAIAGRQEKFRMPWLRIRMPRFRHSDEDSATIVRYLVDHDRIPAGTPQSTDPTAVAATTDSSQREQAKFGRLLAGTRGFSCVACHRVGKFEPRNVALATRGSDLYGLQNRMRPEYFARWLRGPLRVIPNMEMPSFDRPLPDVLDANIHRQHAALWTALTDPHGPPKLDTSTIEQTIYVDVGAPARIIRDLFNVGDALKPRFIAHVFAVGFENGANLLFDLNAMSLRASWAGDLARQRSSGKSWFWEPGTPCQIAERDSPDVCLQQQGASAKLIIAKKTADRHGRLVGYSREGLGVRVNYRLPFEIDGQVATLDVSETLLPTRPDGHQNQVACVRRISVSNVPAGYEVVVRGLADGAGSVEKTTLLKIDRQTGTAQGTFTTPALAYDGPTEPRTPMPVAVYRAEPVNSVPGYDGVRLPLPWSVMPTALAWSADGALAFSSLKGHVYLARDTDGDGLEEQVTLFEEGLAAPYGLIADGNDLIVAQKPELLRLRDTDGDGRADYREVLASGWGYTDDYHNWTTAIVRDSRGYLYVGTGSDYNGRDGGKIGGKWRGKVLKVAPDGAVTPVGHEFRFPMGLAITGDDQIFVTDNQGVQNTFNEINHLVTGAHYGVPSRYEEPHEGAARRAAIQVPHPWTRSVNGIFFLQGAAKGQSEVASTLNGKRSSTVVAPNAVDAAKDVFAGHGIGCEYDSRFLVRFTLQPVGETWQGAVYPFSRRHGKEDLNEFLGTLCGAVSPKGDVYIGTIYDSGWLGGPNIGNIVRLRPNGKLPVGIREIRGYDGEFEITFTGAIDRTAAAGPENFDISGVTREYQGSYATPDSGRHRMPVRSVEVATDGLSLVLKVDRQQTGHLYEITVGKIGPASQPALWPAEGYYTMNEFPERAAAAERRD